MAISVGLRNRLVGFTIVAATLLIFLPVILSKDMIKRPNPDAIAVNEQGAVLDSSGNLVHQGQADTQRALNMGQHGELTLSSVNNQNVAGTATGSAPVAPPKPVTTPERSKTELLTAPAVERKPETTTAQTEILTAPPKPATKPAAKPEPEILTAAKPAPKPAAKPEPKHAAKPASGGDDVIAGTRPTQRYVIQVGVFSQRTNAENVVNKITKAGYSVYAIKVKSNGRELYRVYAAQSNSRDQLNPILTRVNKLCGTKGTIITFNR
ncbi:MAG: SPOR domain-containing protein [Anaerobiospirillum sp.]|nr:SPOR domain-containing protein [Anaerobiospirillum sp.]